jgi:hypothetical protein
MAKKRLTFDVEENLHSFLKKEAAERKLSMGAFCSSLMESGLLKQEATKEGLDPSQYSSYPLDKLRAESLRLGENKPEDWETLVRHLNLEIVKRYRTE